MRIVYDDAQQAEVVNMFNYFFKEIEVLKYMKYDYGTERVQSALVRKGFENILIPNNFEIGKTVSHLHGIGNNCCYPVYYKGNPNEVQQVCSININSGLYGEVFAYLTDYNNNRISNSFELSRWGVKIK